jgi:integrase
MVGKGKWVVGMITIGDVRCGEDYVAGFPRNGKSFTVRLERFLAANEQWVNNIPDLLQGLIGQWSRHGLKESTISVYLKLTEQHLRSIGAIPSHQRGAVLHLLKVARARAAETDIRQAPRASLRTLRDIASEAPPIYRAAFDLMIICGGRWTDIRRLRRKQMQVVSDGSLVVQWRVTKNRRTPADRKTISYPVELGGAVTKTLRWALNQFQADSSQKPFGQLTLAAINMRLRIACHELNIAPAVTSYSFRHNFVQRAKKYCEVHGGSPHELTGHHSDRMIQSSYNEEAIEQGAVRNAGRPDVL